MPQNLSNDEFIALQNLSKNKDLIIQKFDSVVTVDRQSYIKKINTLLKFAVNQEKQIDKVVKRLVESKSMTEKNWNSLKPVGSRPGIMHSSCKVHKVSVENCPPFCPQFHLTNIKIK